jgi:hypothetical protein
MRALSIVWQKEHCRIRSEELKKFERMIVLKHVRTLQIVRHDDVIENVEIPTARWRQFCTVADARREDSRLWLARLLQIAEQDLFAAAYAVKLAEFAMRGAGLVLRFVLAVLIRLKSYE